MKGFRKLRSVINPKELVRNVARRRGLELKSFQVPEIVIMVYGEDLFDQLLKLSNAEKPKVWLYNPDSFPIRFGRIKNKDVTFIRLSIGAPALVMHMEELIACGGKKFILIGFSGSLQKDVDIGDFVIGTDAIREEGTSYHYLSRNIKASGSKELIEALLKSCRKHDVTFHSGTVWTIDAPYRETRRKVSRYQRQGVLCVDMETAALFSLATYRRVMAASLLRISDSLAELKWRSGFDAQKLKLAEEKTAPIVIDTIKTI